MHDNKNMILAITLSITILLLWQVFYVGPRVEEARKQQQVQQSQPTKTQSASKATHSDTAAIEHDVTEVPELLDRKEILREGGRIKINNGKLHGSISLKGARFDDLTLGEYKQHNTPDSEEVVLLSPGGSKAPYFAEFSWVSQTRDTPTPAADTVWYSEDTVLTPEKPVTLTWNNNAGLKFFLTISVDEHYMFTIERSVENYGPQSVSLRPYGIVNRARDLSKQSFYILHEGALGVFNQTLTETTYSDLKDKKKQKFKDSAGWLGMTDKYWLTALIPSQDSSFDTNFTYFHRNGQDRFQVDYLGQPQQVAPGEHIKLSSHFFAGAKKVGLLDKYGEQLNLTLFDRAVDFGMLYFITKPIFKLMTFFNHLLGNFGLAILMLTVVIKLILFPLANKSYVSMHHMKRVQPQLLELKERYGDNRVQMNKEVMELYKREKVNPMSGCLPILIQLPIFFALYKVLFVTIEMRHAPFYGWISDLSAPDPTSLFNLFGLLPFDPPGFLMVGAWPVIMGVTMYLQQKMNPTPPDPIQAKVIKMLPFIFVFLFATFPAGLVIYWAWNNTLSIFQQWVITRNLPGSELSNRNHRA